MLDDAPQQICKNCIYLRCPGPQQFCKLSEVTVEKFYPKFHKESRVWHVRDTDTCQKFQRPVKNQEELMRVINGETVA